MWSRTGRTTSCRAFEDIATKGGQTDASNNPEAYFVSRGGKQPPPGTVVQEDAIWALTTGVDTCQVSAANGGGAIPSTTDIGQPCPSTPTPPAWYVTNGGSQAQNINLANTCTFNGETNNDCYAFTDRGTYDYLESGGSTASPTTVPTNLKIVTRDNSATATGGNTLLTNTFHGYVINPATTNTTLNTVGATDLLDYITSTDGQTAIGQYLQGQDTTPPFLPDAAPDVTASNPPTSIQAGHSFTLTGSVTNLVPGTPALEGIKVTLNGTPTSAPASPGAVVQRHHRQQRQVLHHGQADPEPAVHADDPTDRETTRVPRPLPAVLRPAAGHVGARGRHRRRGRHPERDRQRVERSAVGPG